MVRARDAGIAETQRTRKVGWTTVNIFEDELYFFNPKQDWDVDQTLVTHNGDSFSFKFSQSESRTATLNSAKDEIEFGDGEKWLRRGTGKCGAYRPVKNIKMDFNKPRTCGSEYRYKWSTVHKAFARLKIWFGQPTGDGEFHSFEILKNQFKILLESYRANIDGFDRCRDFDTTVASIFDLSRRLRNISIRSYA